MDDVTFQAFRDSFLEDVAAETTTVARGHKFVDKVIRAWRDGESEADRWVYCDGSGDGGIDLALLVRAEEPNGEDPALIGDTWYLVQGKYGSAFRGDDTLFDEGRKVIKTLLGERDQLNSLSTELVEGLRYFLSKASSNDRIVLVFATVDPLTEPQRKALAEVQLIGRESLGPIFRVESVSVHSIFERIAESPGERIQVTLQATLSNSGTELLVGTVKLSDLHAFLKQYKQQADEDLDRLYEKNVRRFLGRVGRVNKRMRETLELHPERFGLFNNGITIVVDNVLVSGPNRYDLVSPYIVNGCQTTRTIWDVFSARLDSGGTGTNGALADWITRVDDAVVVTKIVKVGATGEELLREITRYTNSQNAVREKDFIALKDNFQEWQVAMAQRDIYLEIQRGGWDSRRAFQKQHPHEKKFTLYANAFDLLKVYGAGWMEDPGNAFGKNSYFLPGGQVYDAMMQDGSDRFEDVDMFAAYLLQCEADMGEARFGRGATEAAYRQTRFLFYFAYIRVVKGLLFQASLPNNRKEISRAITRLVESGDDAARTLVQKTALTILRIYMNPDEDKSMNNEPQFREKFQGDVNRMLKTPDLGKASATPNLLAVIQSQLDVFKNPVAEVQANAIIAALRGDGA